MVGRGTFFVGYLCTQKGSASSISCLIDLLKSKRKREERVGLTVI